MKNDLDNSNIQIKDRFFLIVRANVVNFQVWSASKFVSLANWDDCWNHKLAFCFKHLLKHFPDVLSADATLLALGKFFHHQHLAIDFLQNVGETYKDCHKTPMCSIVTRWQAYDGACKNMGRLQLEFIDFSSMLW